jgi:hypothetical protein
MGIAQLSRFSLLHDRRIVVPIFHQHIYQRPSIGSTASFHQHVELPVGLQLRIMQHCNAPTLFQLMRTTRDERTEATKLFVSDPAVWYRLQTSFLLQRRSASELWYELCFLTSVKQPEIYYPESERDWI